MFAVLAYLLRSDMSLPAASQARRTTRLHRHVRQSVDEGHSRMMKVSQEDSLCGG